MRAPLPCFSRFGSAGRGGGIGLMITEHTDHRIISSSGHQITKSMLD